MVLAEGIDMAEKCPIHKVDIIIAYPRGQWTDAKGVEHQTCVDDGPYPKDYYKRKK